MNVAGKGNGVLPSITGSAKGDFIAREVLEDLALLVSESDNPLEELSEVQRFLKSRIPKETSTVIVDLHISWDIEGHDDTQKNIITFIDSFKPNTIEKVAAWLVVITALLSMIQKDPETNITINNTFIEQTTKNWQQYNYELNQTFNE